MAKAMAPKSLTMMTIGTCSMIKFHGKHFYGKIPAVKSLTIKTMTFIGYLKHVSSLVDGINSCGTLSQLQLIYNFQGLAESVGFNILIVFILLWHNAFSSSCY